MHQRDRRIISFDARGSLVSVKSRVWRNGERKKRVNRRRQRTVGRRARKRKRDRDESKRVEREKKEAVVATWNVRTLAVKGKNGLGPAETLLLKHKSHGATSSECRR